MLNPISILLDARRCVLEEKRDNWLNPFTVLTHAVAQLEKPQSSDAVRVEAPKP